VFIENIGSFVTIDYATSDGIETAKGKLKSVSEEGDIFIEHIHNPKISWGMNIEQVKTYKFSPIREGGDTNANDTY